VCLDLRRICEVLEQDDIERAVDRALDRISREWLVEL
jgi:hypothetical protein